MAGNIINILFGLFWVVIAVGICSKFFARVKTVSAVVVDKQKYTRRVIRKNSASFDKTECVVTFLCKNRKKYFTVSEISFNSYKINQKGILKYKGSRLVEFEC